MKHLFKKIFSFLKGRSFWKCLIFFITYTVALSVLISHIWGDVMSNVLGTIIGLSVSGVLMYLLKLLSGYIEDISKVTDDTNMLKKIYPDEKYCKTVFLNGTSCQVMYNDIQLEDGLEPDVKDDPKKSFNPPAFVEENYADLLKAHDSSYINNADTIRLDDIVVENGKNMFYTSRSTFYHHLTTNRAVDFSLDGVTIRKILEYGPEVNSLSESQMSNHIGINALVFLSDGTILIPRRKNDSTISKNMITSSIATRLQFPKPKKKEEEGEDSQEKNDKAVKPAKISQTLITKEFLFYQNVIDSLSDRLKIKEEDIRKDQIQVKFLGLGQNIYEAGKPQMYFAVKINYIDHKRFSTMPKIPPKNHEIDIDKCTYIADYKSMKFIKGDRISFNAINPKTGKRKLVKVGYEKSFACNIWHFENDQVKQTML